MKIIFGHGNSTLVVFAQDVILPNSSILTGMILLADKRLLR